METIVRLVFFCLEQGFPEARAKPEAAHYSQTACETRESASRIRQHELGGTGSTRLWDVTDSPGNLEVRLGNMT